jgi:signal transduction histidine kinase/CheY-like chemotaxis protein
MIVIAVCLEFFFLNNYFLELDTHVVERAKLIASQLSSSSEYGVVSNNQPFLKNLAMDVFQRQDIRGVEILNSASQILAEAGDFYDAEKNTLLEAKQATGRSTSPIIRYVNNNLLVFQPIFPETVVLNEFETAPVAKPIGAVIVKISLVRSEALKSRELGYTLAASVIFLTITGFIVNLGSRGIVNPINKLSEAIQAIGQGNLEARASVVTRMTEVEVLSHGINLMAEQLQHEREVLQQRVDDATFVIRDSKEKAEQANMSKSRFLAAASHDLRQPMHALGLFLDVLSRTELSKGQLDLLANARAASDASNEMINTLLDYSRIEAGVINPQLQPFKLQTLLNKIENELASLVDNKGIVYRTRETSLVVHSDPALVEVILRNLVSNAIRYTNQGGVLVACRKRGTEASLEVWDTGIGIAPEHQQKVFREFYQLGNPERDRNKGLGLGLAIADGLARTLGHNLTLTSIPLRGSVFRLSLPISSETLPTEQTAATFSKPLQLRSRVMVIDDDESVRSGMLHLLQDWGCECDTAESIEEALSLARLHAPEVVICDYRLRNQLTGVEAIAALRALLGETLPALLITGDTAPGRLREAKASGIPLLHKPVPPGKLYRWLVELQQG